MQARILAAAAAAALAPQTLAQNVEVIYTKINASPTSSIPGTLDLAGAPAPTEWRAIEDLAVRPDGGQWVVKGRTRLGSDLETILVRGSGTGGTMFCQEGRPFLGAAVGELYDFFDTPSPVAWDATGRIAFSARARGGVTSDDEKVILVDLADNHTLVIQQGQPLLGLIDIPANPSGDETLGNSVGSVHLMNDGRVGYVVTPIGNCSTTRYPAFIHTNTAFQQSGVSPIGGEIWDSFILDGAGGTPDGNHWYAEGDTEGPTATDAIFVVDGNVILREGSVVPGTSLVYVDTFQAQMAPNGDYIARGSATGTPTPQWVLRNGTILLKSGDSVEGGLEAWANSVAAVALNSQGDWAVHGKTDNPNVAIDDVVVVNGTVVMREGDQVDLNGNGLFDDDAFLGRGNNTLAAFAANDLALTDDGYLYAIVQLRNGAGVDLNDAGFGTPDAFVRLRVGVPAPQPFCFGDGSGTACPCGNTGAAGNGCAHSANANGANLAASGASSLSADTLLLSGTGMPNSSALYFQGTTQQSGGAGVAFGDGLRCAGGTVIRLGTKFNASGASQYPGVGDPSVSVRGLVGAPGTRTYQVWYRNAAAFCTPDTFNLTNGILVTWIL
ncbi:MAG: hypothetical protein JNK02_17460 [Planctomycetes bacterium]|nr:hypothetical protein [Planctomycetota bacterium]